MANTPREPRNTPIRNYAAFLKKKQRNVEKNSAALLSSGRISNAEWGIVILCLAIADILQFILSLTGLGEIVSEFIDVTVAFLFGCYLMFRGQGFKNSKISSSFFATAVVELIPFVNDLPLWTFDGIYNMSLDRANETIKNMAPKVANTADDAVAYKQGKYRQLFIRSQRRRSSQRDEAEREREERRNRSNIIEHDFGSGQKIDTKQDKAA